MEPNAASPDGVGPEPPPKPSAWLLFLGCVFPALALFVELWSGLCLKAFHYDPIPTPWHALAFAALVLLNGNTHFACSRSPSRVRGGTVLANAVSTGIALIFSLFLLPILPFSILGSLFFGIGSLGLAPFAALGASLSYHGRILRAAQRPVPRSGRLALVGGVVGMVCAAAPEIRPQSTWIGLERARSADPGTSRDGVEWLRRFGDDALLRDACIGELPAFAASGRRWPGFLEEPRAATTRSGPPDEAIYFLVTGRDLAEEAPGEFLRGRRTWIDGAATSFSRTLDPSRALLEDSRLDGVIEADAALGYLEWTWVLANPGQFQNLEAWADVLLPRGRVVSRLTLWVEGTEREAAFAATERTTAAYRSVVRTRRDPVLVTTRGPDRVRVRCFPVPPEGSMKLRFGITFPLTLRTTSAASFRLPQVLTSSFDPGRSLRHAVWIESEGSLALVGGSESERIDGVSRLRESLSPEAFRSPRLVEVGRRGEVEEVWTEDERSARRIRQRIALERQEALPTRRLLCVIEASGRTAASLAEIADALAAAPAGLALSGWIAGDESEPGTAAAGYRHCATREDLVRSLRGVDPRGGVDNVPALIEAIANAGKADRVLRIHSAQPCEIHPFGALQQAYDRGTPPRLIEASLAFGTDLVLRAIDGEPGVSSLERRASLGEDLRALFDRFEDGGLVPAARREVVPVDELPPPGAVRASDHLARLFALDELVALRGRGRDDEALELAVRYQLVTPLSGAVVLESAEQYRQNDLEPVPRSSVPSIPEPGETALLVVVACVLIFLWGRGVRS